MHSFYVENTSQEELVIRVEPLGAHVFVDAGKICKVELYSDTDFEDCLSLRHTGVDMVLDIACRALIYVDNVLACEI